MRKALIAVIVASALFAVGAFAANFTVNSEDIASGTNDVTACAAEVDVDFTTVYDDAGDWDVTGATITFYGSGTTPTANCDGFGVALAVTTTDPANPVTAEGTMASPSTPIGEISLSLSGVKASAVTSAAVLVDGETLNVATPGGGF